MLYWALVGREWWDYKETVKEANTGRSTDIVLFTNPVRTSTEKGVK